MAENLVLILTRKCNRSCKYCYVDKDNHIMDREVARRAINLFLSEPGINKSIKFFGGEPLLAYDLIKELIVYGEQKASEYNKEIKFILNTNGLLLNARIINYLFQHRLTFILNSIYLKDNLRLWEAIRAKNNYRYFIINYFILPSKIEKLFSEFVNLVESGFRKFNFLPAYYVIWNEKQLAALRSELKKISDFYLASHLPISIDNMGNKNSIPLFNEYLTIDYNGDIFDSDAIMFKELRPFRNKIKLGNISKVKRLKSSENKTYLQSVLRRALSNNKIEAAFKVDNILADFVEDLETKSKRPEKRIDLKIGFLCNNQCKLCVQGDKRMIFGNKNFSTIKSEMKKAIKDGRNIVFTGGEATIHKDFMRFVKFACGLKFKDIQIQTNGRMFAYKKFAQDTIAMGATEFAVALHGHSPDLHDYLTGVGGSFEQTIQGIKNLKLLNRRVITNTVITKSNYRHLPEIAKLLVNLGVDQFQFAFVHALGAAKKNFDSIVPRISLVEPYFKKGLDAGIASSRVVMTEAIPYCFMSGYENYIAEKIIPETKIFDANAVIDNFTAVRQKEGKLKGPDCPKCKCFKACEGPWREYPEHFGWSEFNPVEP